MGADNTFGETNFNSDQELKLQVSKIVENIEHKTLEIHFIYSGSINHKNLCNSWEDIVNLIKSISDGKHLVQGEKRIDIKDCEYVQCIENKESENFLTKGKIYKTRKIDLDHSIGLEGTRQVFDKSLFIPSDRKSYLRSILPNCSNIDTNVNLLKSNWFIYEIKSSGNIGDSHITPILEQPKQGFANYEEAHLFLSKIFPDIYYSYRSKYVILETY